MNTAGVAAGGSFLLPTHTGGMANAQNRMLGRALVVAGTGSGLTARTLGGTTGTETHTLTESEMPLHGHPFEVSTSDSGSSNTTGGLMTDSANLAARSAYTGAVSGTAGQQIGGTGGGGSHNNMQPSAFLNAMIKL